MPIGDILDQISGQKATAGADSSTVAKRKPSSDLRGHVTKISRRGSPPPDPARPVSASTSRPANSLVSSSTPKTGARPLPPVSRGTPKPAAPRPVPRLPISKPTNSSTPNASPISKAPPKKGSYAEVLARAQRAQAVMGQVGKLQHKSIEKGTLKAKKDEKPTVQVKNKSKLTSKTTPTYKGTSRAQSPLSKPVDDRSRDAGPRTNGMSRKNGRPTALTKPSALDHDAACKTKFKKAAEATTGYTGTARPKTGVSKKSGPRGGALLKAPSGAKRSQNSYRDEQDDDMDDFIDDDDEIDQVELSYREKQYRYVESDDDESDMEVGLGELAVEERRAEKIARQEDIEEERLEKNLKMAKEEKKRKALEALRASRRR
ncbi:hypothetical protein CDD82_1053 [Ophiocordyceps australis]|uniref:SPT2 chromatin protein n=1 Tax=Ophiocordyceps australis TaxID=1399860 RepID=A0A2C5Y062_9HYPO|nr:hypothetical protein CDD82_1053 [Ophiocordyceps australis]